MPISTVHNNLADLVERLCRKGLRDRYPLGWLPCDGRVLPKEHGLYPIIGVHYGRDEVTGGFRLPDLRGRVHYGVSARGTGNIEYLISEKSGELITWIGK